MYITAQALLERINSSNILTQKGKIVFSFLGVDALIKEKSAMGDLIQEWLGERMKSQGIQYRTSHNTQEFPDFFLDENSNEIGMLEIKTFDMNAGANFDVANFNAYVDSLKTKSYRLDADYLIFGYSLDNGVFTIKKVRLKKIREICCGSGEYPLKIQQKRGMIYNIRPASRESSTSSYSPFTRKMDFIDAIQGTLNQYSVTQGSHTDWKDIVIGDYTTRGGVI